MWWLATVHTRLLQAALSSVVAADPEWPARVAGMEGARIRVRVEDMPLDLVFQPLSDRLVVLPGEEQASADLSMTGRLADFLDLARARKAGKTRVGGVQFHGDLAIGQQFEEALSALEPDWRIPLERLLGRETADILVRILAGLGCAFRERLQDTVEAWKDHAQYGARWSVSRSEWQVFVDEIQDRAGDLARLEARLKRLEARPTCDG